MGSRVRRASFHSDQHLSNSHSHFSNQIVRTCLVIQSYLRWRVVRLGLVLGAGRAPAPLGCRRLSCSGALLSWPLLVLAACSRSQDSCEAGKAMCAVN
jgi:hypothetical protein